MPPTPEDARRRLRAEIVELQGQAAVVFRVIAEETPS